MKRELLIESVLGDTRLAVFEDGDLCELQTERVTGAAAVGSVYLGRTERVLKGLSAAFVDIGLDKPGFLPLDEWPGDIVLRPGEDVLVQVTGDPGGSKGPRLSGSIMLSGKFLVLTPGSDQICLSRRITDRSERERLLALADSLKNEGDSGFIIRTAAAGTQVKAIEEELCALRQKWDGIKARSAYAQAPSCMYEAPRISARLLENCLSDQDDTILCSDETLFEAVEKLCRESKGEKAPQVRLQRGAIPLFRLYRVDERADKFMERKQWLPCGGTVFVDEAEALTVFDVNSAKFVSSSAQDETSLRVNLEASALIARILRFRNISGIVVIDFINMSRDQDRQTLVDSLAGYLKRDRNRTVICGFTPAGLLELTRKRTDTPRRKLDYQDCPVCRGRGCVPTPAAQAMRAKREIGYAMEKTGRKRFAAKGSRQALEALSAMLPPEVELRSESLPGARDIQIGEWIV